METVIGQWQLYWWMIMLLLLFGDTNLKLPLSFFFQQTTHIPSSSDFTYFSMLNKILPYNLLHYLFNFMYKLPNKIFNTSLIFIFLSSFNQLSILYINFQLNLSFNNYFRVTPIYSLFGRKKEDYMQKKKKKTYLSLW